MPAFDPMALPAFDGQRPDDVINRFAGKVGLDLPVGRALHIGEVGYAVVEYEVSAVTHQATTKDGLLTRLHVLKVNRMGHIGLEAGGATLLEAHRLAKEAAGITELPLDNPDAAGALDQDGMTDDEWEASGERTPAEETPDA